MAVGFVTGMEALSIAEDAGSLARNPQASELSKSALQRRLESFAKKAWCNEDVSNLQYLLNAIGSIKPLSGRESEVASWGNTLKNKPANLQCPPSS
jgi:hypothetical protein